MAVDKDALVRDALRGHGEAAHAPIPDGMIGAHPDVAKLAFDPAGASTLLDGANYRKPEGSDLRTLPSTSEPFSVILTVVDTPEFIRMAELISEQLADVGVGVEIRPVSAEEFLPSVVASRSYELLLSGTLLGIDPDPYPFWHSSQANSGLNLAGYANRNADALLEEARAAVDADLRAEKYRAFQDLLSEEVPAVFLARGTNAYAPR
jgi:peptide/nickel transport system substrate-binding protein